MCLKSIIHLPIIFKIIKYISLRCPLFGKLHTLGVLKMLCLVVFSVDGSSLKCSKLVRSTTSEKGTSWQKINQMSIILISEVTGRPSILLMKMVVITSMVVRLTLNAASKKNGLKKVVAKVIIMRRRDGK